MAEPTPHDARTRQWRTYAGIAVLLTGFKLWLVAPDEIVARHNPYDQLRYVEMANDVIEGRWLGRYGPRTLIREPAYPVWLAAVHHSGLRLRMASELLLAASSWGFGTALLCVGAPLWLSATTLGLLLLDPHGLLVQREVLADGFYLPVLLLAMAGLLLASHADRFRWRLAHALWAGLALGVLWTTRPEKPLAAILLATGALLALARAKRRGGGAVAALSAAALLACVGGIGIAAVSSAFASRNERHYGVRVTSDLAAPGYVAAIRALLAIEHAAPRRFVPVPGEVRARAYAASPALRELRPGLEAQTWGHQVSCRMVKVCDDLAGGWFHWTLREAAAQAGHMRSAPAGDAFFHRIASDLEAACERGDFRCRPVLLTFLHPHPESWLPHLPESLGDVLARIGSAGEKRDRLLLADARSVADPVRELFDRVANRGPASAESGWIIVNAHAFADGDPIRRIGLRVGREMTPLVPEPAEVIDAEGHIRFSFQLQLPLRRRRGQRVTLELLRGSGDRTRVRLRDVFEAPVERDGVRVEAEAQPLWPHDRSRAAVTGLLWTGHAWLLRALVVAAVLAAVVGVARRRPWLADPLWSAFALMAVVTAGRILLLAMIDASSFAATSSRYVYPASALAPVVLLVWVAALWRAPRRSG